MFSRSDKPDEAAEFGAEAAGERNPMVLAALAGLLAIAGAFLLVWYLNSGQDGEVATDPGSPEAATTVADATKQVLVVTQTIPRGTSVSELVSAPTVYLTAQAVPEQFVAPSAITSVAELQDLSGLVLASDALAGEQLLRGRFRDPNDFDATAETFRESQTNIETPEGHHAVSFDVPASRALDGSIRPSELVTIIANFRLNPPNGSPREVSIVVLNSVEVIGFVAAGATTGQLTTEVDAVGIGAQGLFRVTVAVLQILGDDGVWTAELDDGDIVDLVELYPAAGQEEEGLSVEVQIPDAEEGADEDSNPGDLSSLGSDDESGDS